MRYKPDQRDQIGRPALFDQDQADLVVDTAGRGEGSAGEVAGASPGGTLPRPDGPAGWASAAPAGVEAPAVPVPARHFLRFRRFWRRHRPPRRPWLADQIGPRRRLRSMVEIIVITVVLGVLIAAVLGAAIGAVVVTLQHALKA
jgi:hypothetical protein